ncbi:MAG: TetR/AcrR family transcriptional regulator [Acidimicrobiales bacterium]
MTASEQRSRVRRGTLSHARVVDAALVLIDAEGVDALSMPKLARHLGVGVMSLYTHVKSKDALLDAVVERVLSELPEPRGDDWRARLRSHFGDLRAALVAHPGLGMVLASKNVAVPAVFDVLERALGDLTAAGLPDQESAHLYYDLLVYTIGFVAWELPRTHAIPQAEYASRWRSAIASLDEARYPTLHQLADALTTVATDQQFHDGIDRIILSAAPAL